MKRKKGSTVQGNSRLNWRRVRKFLLALAFPCPKRSKRSQTVLIRDSSFDETCSDESSPSSELPPILEFQPVPVISREEDNSSTPEDTFVHDYVSDLPSNNHTGMIKAAIWAIVLVVAI